MVLLRDIGCRDIAPARGPQARSRGTLSTNTLALVARSPYRRFRLARFLALISLHWSLLSALQPVRRQIKKRPTPETISVSGVGLISTLSTYRREALYAL